MAKSLEEILDEVTSSNDSADNGSNVYSVGSSDYQRFRRLNPENDSNFAMDTVRDLAGFGIDLARMGVGAIDYGQSLITGESKFGDTYKALDEADQYLSDHMSFARQDADAEVANAEGAIDTIGAYLSNPRAIAGAFFRNAPQVLMTAGGAGIAAKAALKAGTGSMLKKSAEKQLGEKYFQEGLKKAGDRTGEAAQNFAKNYAENKMQELERRIGQVAAKRAGVVAEYAAPATEGAMTVGSTAAAVAGERANNGETATLGDMSMAVPAGLITGAIGKASGRFQGNVEAALGRRFFSGMARDAATDGERQGIVKSAIKGAFGEGVVEEAPQSYQEQVWQNIGAGKEDITEGAAKAAAEGGLIGGLTGAIASPFTRRSRENHSLIGGNHSADVSQAGKDGMLAAQADTQINDERARALLEQQAVQALNQSGVDYQQGATGNEITGVPEEQPTYRPAISQEPNTTSELIERYKGRSLEGALDAAGIQLPLDKLNDLAKVDKKDGMSLLDSFSVMSPEEKAAAQFLLNIGAKSGEITSKNAVEKYHSIASYILNAKEQNGGQLNTQQLLSLIDRAKYGLTTGGKNEAPKNYSADIAELKNRALSNGYEGLVGAVESFNNTQENRSAVESFRNAREKTAVPNYNRGIELASKEEGTNQGTEKEESKVDAELNDIFYNASPEEREAIINNNRNIFGDSKGEPFELLEKLTPMQRRDLLRSITGAIDTTQGRGLVATLANARKNAAKSLKKKADETKEAESAVGGGGKSEAIPTSTKEKTSKTSTKEKASKKKESKATVAEEEKKVNDKRDIDTIEYQSPFTIPHSASSFNESLSKKAIEEEIEHLNTISTNETSNEKIFYKDNISRAELKRRLLRFYSTPDIAKEDLRTVSNLPEHVLGIINNISAPTIPFVSKYIKDRVLPNKQYEYYKPALEYLVESLDNPDVILKREAGAVVNKEDIKADGSKARNASHVFTPHLRGLGVVSEGALGHLPIKTERDVPARFAKGLYTLWRPISTLENLPVLQDPKYLEYVRRGKRTYVLISTGQLHMFKPKVGSTMAKAFNANGEPNYQVVFSSSKDAKGYVRATTDNGKPLGNNPTAEAVAFENMFWTSLDAIITLDERNKAIRSEMNKAFKSSSIYDTDAIKTALGSDQAVISAFGEEDAQENGQSFHVVENGTEEDSEDVEFRRLVAAFRSPDNEVKSDEARKDRIEKLVDKAYSYFIDVLKSRMDALYKNGKMYGSDEDFHRSLIELGTKSRSDKEKSLPSQQRKGEAFIKGFIPEYATTAFLEKITPKTKVEVKSGIKTAKGRKSMLAVDLNLNGVILSANDVVDARRNILSATAKELGFVISKSNLNFIDANDVIGKLRDKLFEDLLPKTMNVFVTSPDALITLTKEEAEKVAYLEELIGESKGNSSDEKAARKTINDIYSKRKEITNALPKLFVERAPKIAKDIKSIITRGLTPGIEKFEPPHPWLTVIGKSKTTVGLSSVNFRLNKGEIDTKNSTTEVSKFAAQIAKSFYDITAQVRDRFDQGTKKTPEYKAHVLERFADTLSLYYRVPKNNGNGEYFVYPGEITDSDVTKVRGFKGKDLLSKNFIEAIGVFTGEEIVHIRATMSKLKENPSNPSLTEVQKKYLPVAKMILKSNESINKRISGRTGYDVSSIIQQRQVERGIDVSSNLAIDVFSMDDIGRELDGLIYKLFKPSVVEDIKDDFIDAVNIYAGTTLAIDMVDDLVRRNVFGVHNNMALYSKEEYDSLKPSERAQVRLTSDLNDAITLTSSNSHLTLEELLKDQELRNVKVSTDELAENEAKFWNLIFRAAEIASIYEFADAYREEKAIKEKSKRAVADADALFFNKVSERVQNYMLYGASTSDETAQYLKNILDMAGGARTKFITPRMIYDGSLRAIEFMESNGKFGTPPTQADRLSSISVNFVKSVLADFDINVDTKEEFSQPFDFAESMFAATDYITGRIDVSKFSDSDKQELLRNIATLFSHELEMYELGEHFGEKLISKDIAIDDRVRQLTALIDQANALNRYLSDSYYGKALLDFLKRHRVVRIDELGNIDTYANGMAKVNEAMLRDIAEDDTMENPFFRAFYKNGNLLSKVNLVEDIYIGLEYLKDRLSNIKPKEFAPAENPYRWKGPELVVSSDNTEELFNSIPGSNKEKVRNLYEGFKRKINNSFPGKDVDELLKNYDFTYSPNENKPVFSVGEKSNKETINLAYYGERSPMQSDGTFLYDLLVNNYRNKIVSPIEVLKKASGVDAKEGGLPNAIANYAISLIKSKTSVLEEGETASDNRFKRALEKYEKEASSYNDKLFKLRESYRNGKISQKRFERESKILEDKLKKLGPKPVIKPYIRSSAFKAIYDVFLGAAKKAVRTENQYTEIEPQNPFDINAIPESHIKSWQNVIDSYKKNIEKFESRKKELNDLQTEYNKAFERYKENKTEKNFEEKNKAYERYNKERKDFSDYEKIHNATIQSDPIFEAVASGKTSVASVLKYLDTEKTSEEKHRILSKIPSFALEAPNIANLGLPKSIAEYVANVYTEGKEGKSRLVELLRSNDLVLSASALDIEDCSELFKDFIWKNLCNKASKINLKNIDILEILDFLQEEEHAKDKEEIGRAMRSQTLLTSETGRDLDNYYRNSAETKSFLDAMRDSSLGSSVKQLVQNIQKSTGLEVSRISDILSKVEFGLVHKQDALNGINGYAIKRTNGKLAVFLNIHNETMSHNFKAFALGHEVFHCLSGIFNTNGTPVSRDDSFDMNITSTGFTPIGEAAKELAKLMEDHRAIREILNDYPISLFKTGYSKGMAQDELFAQIGAIYIHNPAVAALINRKAPELSKLINKVFNGGNPNGQSKDTLQRDSSQTSEGSDASGEAEVRGVDNGSDELLGRGLRGRPSSQGGETMVSQSLSDRTPYSDRSRVHVPENGSGRGEQAVSEPSAQEQASLGRAQRAGGNPGASVYAAGNGAGTQTLGNNRGNAQGEVNASISRLASALSDNFAEVVDNNINKLPQSLREPARVISETLRSTASGLFNKFVNNLSFTHDLTNRLSKAGIKSAEKLWSAITNRDGYIRIQQLDDEDIKFRYNEFTKPMQKQISKVLAMETELRAWAFDPEWMTPEELAANVGNILDRQVIAPEWRKLSDKAQQFIKDVHGRVRAKQNEMIDSFEKYIKDLLGDELKANQDYQKLLINKVAMLKNYVNKPYLPLVRRGDYVVVAKSDEYAMHEKANDREWLAEHEADKDSEGRPLHYVVQFVTMAQRETAKRHLLEDLNGSRNHFTVAAFPRTTMEKGDANSISTIQRIIDDVVARVQADDISKEFASKMGLMLSDIYYSALEEDNILNSNRRRRNIAGYDADMMKSYISYSERSANYLANLRYGGAIRRSLHEMEEESKNRADRSVVNEVIKVLISGERIAPNEYADTTSSIKRWTSRLMLFTAPQYYLQNATQPFLMSLPYMAGRNIPMGKATAAMMRNMKEVGKLSFIKSMQTYAHIDINKLPFNAETKAMLNFCQNRNLLDVGLMTGEIGSLGSIGTDPVNKVTNFIDSLGRKSEVINRIATAKTAYEMALKQNLDKGMERTKAITDATAYAAEVLEYTHGNTASGNTPRFIKGGLRSVLFQFRRFQLLQASLICKLANGALSGETPEMRAAMRRALVWTIGTNFAMTGIRGAPLGIIILMLAGAVGGEDDEDGEDVLRKAIGDKNVSNLLLRGIPALLGADVSDQIGMQNVFSIFPFIDFDTTMDKASYNEILAGMAGPTAMYGQRVYEGFGYLLKGDISKGTERMMPRGLLSNLIAAERLGREGLTKKNGVATIGPDEFSFMDLTMKSLGLNTNILSDKYKLQDRLIRANQRYSDEEGELYRQYMEAMDNKDRLKMAQIRREWVKLQKERARRGFKPKAVTQLLSNYKQRDKERKNAIGGVSSNSTNEGFLRYWVGL